MRRLFYAISIVFLVGLPVQALADSLATAILKLQIAGPYTLKSEESYGEKEPLLAKSSSGGLLEKKGFDFLPGTIPGCTGYECYNMYAAGYSEADLSRGILKTFAKARVTYEYSASTEANSLPTQASALAEFKDTLSVTVPAGSGNNYYLGVTYDVHGTMFGSGSYSGSYPSYRDNCGWAGVWLYGTLWAGGVGGGEGTQALLSWQPSTTNSVSTEYSTAGEFGIDLPGQDGEYFVTVNLTLALHSVANVFGVLPGEAVSNFGSTAHAALMYDPRLIVHSDGGFPVATTASVPEPSTILLVGIGLMGVAAAKRGRKK